MAKLKRVSWLPWALVAVNSLVVLIGLWTTFADRGIGDNPVRLAGDIISGLSPVVFAVLAALILYHQPDNRVGWLMALPSFTFILSIPVENYLKPITTAPPPTLTTLVVTWLSNWGWIPLTIPLTMIPLFFPSGRLLSPRWRWVFLFGVSLAVGFILLASFQQNLAPLSDANWKIANPIGFISSSLLGIILIPWSIFIGIFTLLCVISLFVRYRRAGEVERTQIKWLLYACGVFGLVSAIQSIPNFEIQSIIGEDVWNLIFTLLLLTLPVSITIAILRYRLWDIDIIIRRTLVYSALTAVLALVYFGTVILLQQALRLLTGQTSQAAIALSTLVIAALFTPLRRRIQDFIDRRFYRRRYDAAQAISAFSTGLRDEVDLQAISDRLIQVASETVQPANISLWLKQDGKRRT